MTAFSNVVEIGCERDEVFAYLSDLENVPAWNWAIDSTERITPGPPRVGTRYHQRRSVPRPASETVEITELVPPARLRVVGNLGPFKADLTYELEATPGGTTVTNTVQLQAGLGLGFLSEIAARRIRSSVGENLLVLKSLLEQHPR